MNLTNSNKMVYYNREQKTDFFMPTGAFSRRSKDLTVFCSHAERSPFLLEKDMSIIKYTCLKCGKIFEDYISNKRKYCSCRCAHLGKSPHNIGKKYTMLDSLKIGTIRIRLDGNNKKRHWIKVSYPSKWLQLSHYVWEKETGKSAYNQIIHHKDLNSLNDNFYNLEIVSRRNHALLHLTNAFRYSCAKTFSLAWRKKQSKIVTEIWRKRKNARPIRFSQKQERPVA